KWFSANRGCRTTSISPESRCAFTIGTPLIGVGSSTPSLRSRRKRPGRSVMRMPPSGSQARLHGFARPPATIETLILCCSAVSSTHGPSPSAARGTPMGAPRCVHTSDAAVSISATTTPACTKVATRARMAVLLLGCSLSDGDGVARRAGRPLEAKRREHVRELVDIVARQHLRGEVLVEVDAVLRQQQLVHGRG